MRPAPDAFATALDAYRRGDGPRAEKLCRELLNTAPDSFDALNLLGGALVRTQKFSDALEAYQRVLALAPSAEIHYNLGNVLKHLGRFEEALDSYARALELRPEYAEAHNNQGLLLKELGRFDRALDAFERALRLRPGHAGTHYNRALALRGLERHIDAVGAFTRSLELDPRPVEVWIGFGASLQRLRRHEEAVRAFSRALDLDPRSFAAAFSLGVTLQLLHRPQDALAAFTRALELRTDSAEAERNRADTLAFLKRYDDALEGYMRVLDLEPHHEWVPGVALITRQRLADWRDLEGRLSALIEGVHRGEPVTPPWPLLTLIDSPAVHRSAAEIWSRAHTPTRDAAPPTPLPAPRTVGRVRVGYFSSDFHAHATAYLAAELFELHDRSRFEVIAFSFGPDASDPLRTRLVAAFERFIDVRGFTDEAIVTLSRKLGIDIAVDLKGYTANSRPGVFERRAAPLQVSYLGYPGTLGTTCMDYLVADITVIPPEQREHYVEKLVLLPHSYQVNDRQRAIAGAPVSREALGLPASGFVYCCFNDTGKITPTTFDRWMRILAATPDSVLWLLGPSEATCRNLRREAEARGVPGGRLVFGAPWPHAEHLARYRGADLFLDTLPCNAHTTASDALWAGLPVLTLIGQSFAARVAASLLNAVGLPELITTRGEDYESLAVALARDPLRLQGLREKLRSARDTAPLFDSPAFTRALETAYTEIQARRVAGLPPADLWIDDHVRRG
jgi:predicted O-linked N-acetylglucosamine transferase (SPINDLY family)